MHRHTEMHKKVQNVCNVKFKINVIHPFYFKWLVLQQDYSTNSFISVWLQHYSRMDGGRRRRRRREGRVDWLVLALWMDSVVVENWYHSQRRRERETLGRSWNEKNRCTANRGRGASPAVDIKCIYTQACVFFLPAASSLSYPPPLFSVTALKGLMFILKDIGSHVLARSRACEQSSFRTPRRC